MTRASSLPGSPSHQARLAAIVALYATRADALAVIAFGSLGKGTWDEHSDLDLAVVLADDAQVDMPAELERVRAALAGQGEPALFMQLAGDEGYWVLPSLSCVAIRYHTLAATSPYLLEGCRILWGKLDVKAIHQAAKANQRTALPPDEEVRRALWLALQVDTALQRRQFWPGLQALERMRGALLNIFATSRGGTRAHRVFEKEASAPMKARFAHTLPHHDAEAPAAGLRSLRAALMALLDLLEFHLAELSDHQISLGPGEREVITRLRARQQG